MNGIGECVRLLIATLFCLCVIFVPLGMWKLVEILIFIYNHVSWK